MHVLELCFKLSVFSWSMNPVIGRLRDVELALHELNVKIVQRRVVVALVKVLIISWDVDQLIRDFKD